MRSLCRFSEIRPPRRLVRLTAILAMLALAVSGCGDGQQPGTTPSGETSGIPTSADGATPSPSALALDVYLVRDDRLGVGRRAVPHTVAVAREALEELLRGPSARDADAGLVTAIPAGTRLLGIAVRDGLATVDLSSEFVADDDTDRLSLRVAQVVYTVTQFETVERVAFRLEGSRVETLGRQDLSVWPPVTRLDLADAAAPAILVESPAPWQQVESPTRITGMSNTFEGTILYELRDDSGTILTRGHATSSGGNGVWGEFDFTIRYLLDAPQRGRLTLFEQSAKDGSRIHEVEIPLMLGR